MRGKPLPFSGKTPVTLIHRLHEGRKDDWTTFVTIYTPAVLKLVEMYGLPRPDADDVTSIVMHSLEGRLRKPFRVWKDGRFRNYVARATLNEVVRFKKDVRKRRAVSVNDEHQPELESLVPAPLETLMQFEEQAMVRLCLDRLRNSPRTIRRNFLAFHEYVIEDKPAKDVAKKYGIKVQRVFEVKREMLNRLELIFREFDMDVGEA